MKQHTPKIAVIGIKYIMPKYQAIMLLKDIKVDLDSIAKFKKDKVTELNIIACHSGSIGVNRINRYVKELFDDFAKQYKFIVKVTFVLVRGRHVIGSMTAELVRQHIDKLKESGVDTITYEIPQHIRKHKHVNSKRRKPIITKAVSLGLTPTLR